MLTSLFMATTLAQIPTKKILFWDDHEEQSKMVANHSVWQSVLDKYLDSEHPSGISRFDYYGMTEVDQQRLRDYLDHLQLLEPRQFAVAEQKAFWINLYNASLVARIIDNNVKVNSIRAIRSGVFTPFPWTKNIIEVAQQKISLNDIQNGIIRPIYNDRRMHYALHKASLGSPNLQQQAFTGKNVEALLDLAEKEFVNNSKALTIDDGDLLLSAIYRDYVDDFADGRDGLIVYFKQVLEPDSAQKLDQFNNIRFAYDWSLNTP